MIEHTILIVDDEKHTREGLRRSLEEDFEVYVAADVQSALQLLEEEPVDLLLTDLRLGAGESGLSLIEQVLKKPDPPICIMMTAYGSVDTAVDAMKRGAYDFVTKPVNLDRLEVLIRRALRERHMETENRDLRQKINKNAGLEQIIGRSAAMESIFNTIRQVAPTRATVLIEGENGTGKELVAHALHQLSNRSKNAFVAVHCAALSPTLLESELFGHEKGAFSSAHERRLGRFEQADGGTLFLDEIGEIDASTQVKILRVLGERAFERVGGNQLIKVDVRLIAATNKNLEAMVQEGKFREDLFYRLNVVRVRIPSLRERREDIPLLVSAFLKQSSKENEKPLREISPDAMAKLLEYPWPGNVRQLRAAIDHGVVLAAGDKITLRDIPSEISCASPLFPGSSNLAPQSSAPFNLEETEQNLIQRALDQFQGNITKAAAELGISRRTLHRKLKARHR